MGGAWEDEHNIVVVSVESAYSQLMGHLMSNILTHFICQLLLADFEVSLVLF